MRRDTRVSSRTATARLRRPKPGSRGRAPRARRAPPALPPARGRARTFRPHGPAAMTRRSFDAECCSAEATFPFHDAIRELLPARLGLRDQEPEAAKESHFPRIRSHRPPGRAHPSPRWNDARTSTASGLAGERDAVFQVPNHRPIGVPPDHEIRVAGDPGQQRYRLPTTAYGTQPAHRRSLLLHHAALIKAFRTGERELVLDHDGAGASRRSLPPGRASS